MELQYSRMNELGRLGSVNVVNAWVVDGDGLVCGGSGGLRVRDVPGVLLDVLEKDVAQDVLVFVEALDGFTETSDGCEVNVVKLGDVAQENDVDVREAFTRGTGPADAGDLCPISVEGVGTGARDAVAEDIALEEVAEVLTLVLGAVVGFLSKSGDVREVAADAVDLGRDRRDGPEVVGGGDGV